MRAPSKVPCMHRALSKQDPGSLLGHLSVPLCLSANETWYAGTWHIRLRVTSSSVGGGASRGVGSNTYTATSNDRVMVDQLK